MDHKNYIRLPSAKKLFYSTQKKEYAKVMRILLHQFLKSEALCAYLTSKKIKKTMMDQNYTAIRNIFKDLHATSNEWLFIFRKDIKILIYYFLFVRRYLLIWFIIIEIMFIRKQKNIYHIGRNTVNFMKIPLFTFATKFNAKKDYYTILEIPKDASNDQIRRAF